MSDEQYLIWSHQHNGWWRAGGWGYTSTLWEAGRFDADQIEGQLRWTEYREYSNDGKPHEIYIAVPTLEDIAGGDAIDIVQQVLDLLGKRVLEATNEAIQSRPGGAS